MRHNHLLEPIQCILDAAVQPLSEYELIQLLQSQGWLDDIEMGDDLSLYGVHFLVYNALYQLSEHYRASPNQALFISALAIEVIDTEALAVQQEQESDSMLASAVVNTAETTDQSGVASLAAFYLDWENLDGATKASVDTLLESFWCAYVQDDDYVRALKILQVNASDGYKMIKQQYRRLVMRHHPDRGGKNSDFHDLHWAFSIMQRRINNG